MQQQQQHHIPLAVVVATIINIPLTLIGAWKSAQGQQRIVVVKIGHNL
jgi:hypothetical protein